MSAFVIPCNTILNYIEIYEGPCPGQKTFLTLQQSSTPVRRTEVNTNVCTETPLEIDNYCAVLYFRREVNSNVPARASRLIPAH